MFFSLEITDESVIIADYVYFLFIFFARGTTLGCGRTVSGVTSVSLVPTTSSVS